MKKLLMIAMFAFGAQMTFAQTKSAKANATEYLMATGVTAQFDAMKAQVKPLLLEGKENEFNKDFDETLNGLVDDLSTLVASTYSEKELADVIAEIKKTGQFVELPASDNDEELNQKVQSKMSEFVMKIQQMIMKYGDQEKIKKAQEETQQ